MEDTNNSSGIKFILTIFFMVLVFGVVINITKFLKDKTNFFIVSEGSLEYEEQVEGYIIREETVLQGENYKNGMVQILSDGERAGKGETIFRYYSNSEENILNQISEIDKEINDLVETTNLKILTSDISSLENQIEKVIDSMHNLNYLQSIRENKNKIDAYISKKTQMTGNASPEDSYVKQLADKRNMLEKELEADSEIVTAPISGMASYRIDGLEEILKVDSNNINSLEYLNKELLDSFELKVGASIPLSNEKGKIVNNFKCYIAVPIDTEKSMSANVDDTVGIRLPNIGEIKAKIAYIKDEEKDRIIVLEIDSNVSQLLEYRKISFEIIWWKYTGLKVSNSSLIEEDDKIYVEKNKAGGFTDKILVKVLRQNDTFSIVENYDEDELRQLGLTEEEIENAKKIKLYDEIVLH